MKYSVKSEWVEPKDRKLLVAIVLVGSLFVSLFVYIIFIS